MPRADTQRFVEQAYLAHAAGLERQLSAFTRDPAAAEELVQEAFIRLLLEVEAGRAPSNVGGWLRQVGRNLATSRGRRQSVADRHRRELLGRATSPSPESLAIAAEDQRVVVAALASLAPADRTAMVMAAHGVTGPEIARTIGRSHGATRTMLCRARSRLRTAVVAGSAA